MEEHVFTEDDQFHKMCQGHEIVNLTAP